jgi:hypothetical protein
MAGPDLGAGKKHQDPDRVGDDIQTAHNKIITVIIYVFVYFHLQFSMLHK